MFASGLDAAPLRETSNEEWGEQLADLIRRDHAGHDELDDALLDAARLADNDDPWLEEPFACPLDDASADPAALSDTAIIDTITALQHHLDWAGARQARLLAEFTQAVMLRDVLPDVLDAREHGRIDVTKVRAICDACLRVPVDHAAAVAARILPRAGTQTVAQLRESLKAAVIAADPEGANQRHTRENTKRRVTLYPEEDGMATLAAYLTASKPSPPTAGSPHSPAASAKTTPARWTNAAPTCSPHSPPGTSPSSPPPTAPTANPPWPTPPRESASPPRTARTPARHRATITAPTPATAPTQLPPTVPPAAPPRTRPPAPIGPATATPAARPPLLTPPTARRPTAARDRVLRLRPCSPRAGWAGRCLGAVVVRAARQVVGGPDETRPDTPVVA